MLGGVAFGCSEENPIAKRGAAEVKVRKLHFKKLDRWVRRAVAADPAFARGMFEETVFAPYRRDSDVLSVWVTRGNTTYAMREEAPLGSMKFTRVRVPNAAGIEVSFGSAPERRARPRDPVVQADCVYLRRVEDGPDGNPVGVIAAYRLSEP